MLHPQRITPLPHQESVWDYPRPPRLESVAETLKVVFNGVVIAETSQAFRVLETSHPPTYYIPQVDIQMQYLTRVPNQHTFCEFKGQAEYWDLQVDKRTSPQVAWSYPHPTPDFMSIQDYLAFYASRIDEAYVGAERVQPQSGDFYGGWITSKIVGPFKGGAGTQGW